MNIVILMAALLLIGGCSGEKVEEFVFRKTIEFDLVERCGEGDEACVKNVRSQIKICMDKNNWQELIDNEDNDELYIEFAKNFYPCFKDDNGDPLFG